MITPSYLGETIEYSSLHACRSTLEDPTASRHVLTLPIESSPADHEAILRAARNMSDDAKQRNKSPFHNSHKAWYVPPFTMDNKLPLPFPLAPSDAAGELLKDLPEKRSDLVQEIKKEQPKTYLLRKIGPKARAYFRAMKYEEQIGDSGKPVWVIPEADQSKVKDFLAYYTQIPKLKAAPVEVKDKATEHELEQLELRLLLLLTTQKQELRDYLRNNDGTFIEYGTLDRAAVECLQLQYDYLVAKYIEAKSSNVRRGDILVYARWHYETLHRRICDGTTFVKFDGAIPASFACPAPFPIMYWSRTGATGQVHPNFVQFGGQMEFDPAPERPTYITTSNCLAAVRFRYSCELGDRAAARSPREDGTPGVPSQLYTILFAANNMLTYERVMEAIENPKTEYVRHNDTTILAILQTRYSWSGETMYPSLMSSYDIETYSGRNVPFPPRNDSPLVEDVSFDDEVPSTENKEAPEEEIDRLPVSFVSSEAHESSGSMIHRQPTLRHRSWMDTSVRVADAHTLRMAQMASNITPHNEDFDGDDPLQRQPHIVYGDTDSIMVRANSQSLREELD